VFRTSLVYTLTTSSLLAFVSKVFMSCCSTVIIIKLLKMKPLFVMSTHHHGLLRTGPVYNRVDPDASSSCCCFSLDGFKRFMAYYQRPIAKLAMWAHLIQFIVVLVLRFTMERLKSGGGEIPVYYPVQHWYVLDANNTAVYSRHVTIEPAFTFSIPVLIILFFGWSFFFMLFYVYYLLGDPKNNTMDVVLASIRWRYAEYSVSAAGMIMGIGIEAGVGDVYTLFGFAMFIFVTNMIGLVADLLFDVASQSISMIWNVQRLAWGTVVFPFIVICSAFFVNISFNPVTPPWFVYTVIFQMFGMFALFGLVQIWDFLCRPSLSPPRLEEHYKFITAMYDLLSLTTKSNLAWFILIPVIQGMF
jgi:hypothetical protein